MSTDDQYEEGLPDVLTGGATPPPRVLMLNDQRLERGLTPPPRIVTYASEGEGTGSPPTPPPQAPPPATRKP
jgi:hypothetical protein